MILINKLLIYFILFLQTYKPNYKLPIDWLNKDKPADEPSCGFNNEKCSEESTHIFSLVVAGILAVTLFCAVVITISIYRKWKIEQEIEGLLWKINPADINGYRGKDIVASPSKVCNFFNNLFKIQYTVFQNINILYRFLD